MNAVISSKNTVKAVLSARSPILCLVLVAIAAAAVAPRRALAAPKAGRIAAYSSLFALGAAGAFVGHESGHVAMNAVLGNRPHLRRVDGLFGIPFVAISPDIRCSPAGCVGAQGQRFTAGSRGRALIAAAGFGAQFVSSEVILSLTPDVLYQPLPLLHGWLAFNAALALGYATTCLFGLENDYGDASGVAAHARLPRAVVASGLLVPTMLDVARAVWPHTPWLVWTSRASKVAFFGLVAAR